MSRGETIVGFAFDLERPDGSRIENVRLQGSGGLRGDENLHSLNKPHRFRTVEYTEERILLEAQREYRRYESVRINYPGEHWSKRIETVKAKPIACRAIYNKG